MCKPSVAKVVFTPSNTSREKNKAVRELLIHNNISFVENPAFWGDEEPSVCLKGMYEVTGLEAITKAIPLLQMSW